MQSLVPPGDAFPFYEKNTGPGGLSGWPIEVGMSDTTAREKYMEECLESNWTTTAIKGILSELDINLQHEPAYSRKIFSYLLAKSVRTKAVDASLFRFLDDLSLNIRGSGNYAAAVEHLSRHETRLSQRSGCLGAIARALELGLIPPNEVRAIVKAIPKIRGVKDPKYMLEWYRQIWDAIGRCDVLSHGDLDAETVDAWLGILEQQGSAAGMDLATEIILATQHPDSNNCSWVPTFIIRWLDLQVNSGSNIGGTFVAELLNHFNPNAASEYMIRVTEDLALLKKDHHRMLLLERWQDCLLDLQDARSLISSSAWLDMDLQKAVMPKGNLSESTELSKDHRIILRLWVLRTLIEHFDDRPWKRSKHVEAPIIQLFDYYEFKIKQTTDGDFLSNLMKGIHDLDIPFSSLMMLAVDMKIRKNMTKKTRKTLQKLERSRVSFADLFADLDMYNSSKLLFFNSFEKTVCQIDVSSMAFINHVVHLAKTGDSKSIWTLIRLLRSHTPLKISLAKSWPVPDPPSPTTTRTENPDQTTTTPNTNSQLKIPNPYASLEMIHILAIILSCSKNLTPCRSFHLVHWLYEFLMTHNAPVKPSLVRAMYHAGIIRYQRKGLRVAPTRYLYIFELVKRFEEPEVARELMEGPRFGVSRVGLEDE